MGNFEANDFFNTTTADRVNAEIERRKKVNEERKANYVPDFYLNEKLGSAIIRFVGMKKMEDEPLTFYEHRVWDPFFTNWDKSKGAFVNHTCINQKMECPLCMRGDQPTWYAVFRVIHVDNVEKDTNTNKEITKPKFKIWKMSSKVMGVLSQLYLPQYEKSGKIIKEGIPLSSKNVFVRRTGTGSNTVYTFSFIDKSEDWIPENNAELVEKIKKTNLLSTFMPTEEKLNDMEKIAQHWDPEKNKNKWASSQKSGNTSNSSKVPDNSVYSQESSGAFNTSNGPALEETDEIPF